MEKLEHLWIAGGNENGEAAVEKTMVEQAHERMLNIRHHQGNAN